MKELTAGDDCDVYDYCSGVDDKTGATIIYLGKQQIARIMYGVTPRLSEEQIRKLSVADKNELVRAIGDFNAPIPLQSSDGQPASTETAQQGNGAST